jgi:hypothetical protein
VTTAATIPASLLAELHTGDLTASCPRSVLLRHEGKVVKVAGQALYQGQLFHKTAELIHRSGDWVGIPGHIQTAAALVLAELKQEGRSLTAACQASMADHQAEVQRWAFEYAFRFDQYFRKCRVYGIEIPMRLTLMVDGQPQEMASHIDLLFLDPDGNLCLWDWKSQEEAPTRAYLDRNFQLGTYFLGVLKGELLIDDQWLSFSAEAIVSWVHVRYVLPYGKAGSFEDEAGQVTQYVKGDPRPLRRLVQEIFHQNPQRIEDEIAVRVRMNRAGLFPMNPSPVGCMVCDSLRHCPHFAQEPRQ